MAMGIGCDGNASWCAPYHTLFDLDFSADQENPNTFSTSTQWFARVRENETRGMFACVWLLVSRDRSLW